MPDQLFLDLGANVPRLPAAIAPMLARPATEPFDSPDHLFEPTWGGLRALAFVEPDPATGALGLRLLDADGRDVAASFPELAALPDALAAPFAVLDGEVIVPDGSGHADAAALGARLEELPPAADAGESGSRGPDAVYLAFDLLYAEGRPLLGQPLSRRRQLLAALVTPAAGILVVPAVTGDGRALFEAAVTQGLPAILARHARSPYLAGRRSGLWQSVSTRAGRPLASRAAPVEAAPDDLEEQTPDRRRPVLALIRKLPLPFDED